GARAAGGGGAATQEGVGPQGDQVADQRGAEERRRLLLLHEQVAGAGGDLGHDLVAEVALDVGVVGRPPALVVPDAQVEAVGAARVGGVGDRQAQGPGPFQQLADGGYAPPAALPPGGGPAPEGG